MPTTILSINFNIPESWHDLGDKQLRYVYQLLAGNSTADEIKILAYCIGATQFKYRKRYSFSGYNEYRFPIF